MNEMTFVNIQPAISLIASHMCPIKGSVMIRILCNIWYSREWRARCPETCLIKRHVPVTALLIGGLTPHWCVVKGLKGQVRWTASSRLVRQAVRLISYKLP